MLERALKLRGVAVHANARVGGLEHTEDSVVVPFESGGETGKIEVDQVLVAIGRRPVTEDLDLQRPGVTVDGRGFIEVDTATMVTSRENVYAIGDCVPTPGLAHVAYAEAVMAIQAILGEQPTAVDCGRVPWVVYTDAEVAWPG